MLSRPFWECWELVATANAITAIASTVIDKMIKEERRRGGGGGGGEHLIERDFNAIKTYTRDYTQLKQNYNMQITSSEVVVRWSIDVCLLVFLSHCCCHAIITILWPYLGRIATLQSRQFSLQALSL